MAWKNKTHWERSRMKDEYRRLVARAAKNTGQPIAFHDRYSSEFTKSFGEAFFDTRGEPIGRPWSNNRSRTALLDLMFISGEIEEPTEDAFFDRFDEGDYEDDD